MVARADYPRFRPTMAGFIPTVHALTRIGPEPVATTGSPSELPTIHSAVSSQEAMLTSAEQSPWHG